MFYKKEFLFTDFACAQSERGVTSGFDYTLLSIQDNIPSLSMLSPVKTAFWKQDRNGDDSTESKYCEYWRHCLEGDAVRCFVYFRYVALPVILTQSVEHSTDLHLPQAATERNSYDSLIFRWSKSNHIFKNDLLSKML